MRWALAVALAACASPSADVTGPFSGEVRTYHVDVLRLPTTTSEAEQLGDDLDGDGTVDDQLGTIMAALLTTHDATTHGPDMIASGALASVVELQADKLDDDGTVGVTFRGEAGAAATVVGGRLRGGAFEPNRTRETSHAGAAIARLPVFADADPIDLPLEGLEIDLAPDGAGGFDGLVRGAIPIEAARTAAHAGVLQMMTTNPTAHLVFARIIDTNHDGAIDLAEIADSSLLGAFLVGDVQLGGAAMLSVGFAIHLSPDPPATPPADACHDRLRDGDETDVDCGGTCGPCATGATCTAPADCQSAACDAGHCRAPTCSDGVRDGFESDADCGAACATCAVGQRCATGDDCASTRCDAAVGSTGVCAS